MRRPHKVEVAIVTSKDIPEDLREEFEEVRKTSLAAALEVVLDYLLSNLEFYTVTQDRFARDRGLMFTFSASDEEWQVVKIMEEDALTLSELCTWDGRVFITEGDTTREAEEQLSKYTLPASEAPLEWKRDYRMMLKGGNVRKYVPQWSPYNEDSKLIRVNALRSELPSAPRLLIKDYASEPTVAVDLKCEYGCLRTVYVAYPNPAKFEEAAGYEVDAKALCLYVAAVLNSRLMKFWYLARFYTTRMGRGNFRFRTQFIGMAPIKAPAKDRFERIVKLARHIIALKRAAYLVKDRIDSFPSSYIPPGTAMVKIAFLTKRTDRKGRRKRCRFKDARLSGPVLIFGDKSYIKIEFEHEEHARFVYEVLRRAKEVKYDDLMRMEVPRSPDDARHALGELKENEKRLKNLENKIRSLQEQINEEVFKIYIPPDIRAKAVKAIETLLKRCL